MTAAVALQPSPGVALRAGGPADHPYVHATWLRHYRRHSPDAQRVPERVYTVEQSELIRGILGRSALVVAADESDPTLILGYVVAGANAVHWLHVKSGFRHLGIARLLAGTLGPTLYYTHEVTGAAALWRALGLTVAWNPYRAWLP